ncbi:MAG: hypothetical protein Q8P59_13115, partial [Dehalococcoidia bacterium]|nr:hypothetical protein [Dehalococcoidia bacterium]
MAERKNSLRLEEALDAAKKRIEELSDSLEIETLARKQNLEDLEHAERRAEEHHANRAAGTNEKCKDYIAKLRAEGKRKREDYMKGFDLM